MDTAANTRMTSPQAPLETLLDKVALAGLNYFEADASPVRQRLVAGTVVRASSLDGITLQLLDGRTEITLPADLSPWCPAPGGRYFCCESGAEVLDPDYLVCWDIYHHGDGAEEWCEWVPGPRAAAVEDEQD